MKQPSRSWIRIVPLSLRPPSLEDNTADTDRLVGYLKTRLHTDYLFIDLVLLRRLPELLTESGFDVQAVLTYDRGQWHLVDIVPRGKDLPILGMALDLGTTQMAFRLIDLVSKKSLTERSFPNPQVDIGPDILTRIHYSEKPEGLKTLNQRVLNGINEGIRSVCSSRRVTADRVVALSVAGNTAMTHLFLGLHPGRIIREPYIPVVNKPETMAASQVGITIHPSARVFVFPNVGSYFGGDIIAGILFTDMHHTETASILVDVGTNAEVVLGNSSWLVGCAGAAGPALEGDVTRMGMMANPGAIDRVEMVPGSDRFRFHTIENRLPKGICGSGLIDLAACLFLSGMIDVRGKLVPSRCGARYRIENDSARFEVVSGEASESGNPLSISQSDLDSLVRSKAAMYTILETIFDYVGIPLKDITRFNVAGAFGSFIDPKSAISIGMLPDLPLGVFRALGNSSLEGASMLLNQDMGVDEIDAVRDRITYVELNVNQEFMNRFSAARFFPHTDKSRFPSVKPWT